MIKIKIIEFPYSYAVRMFTILRFYLEDFQISNP